MLCESGDLGGVYSQTAHHPKPHISTIARVPSLVLVLTLQVTFYLVLLPTSYILRSQGAVTGIEARNLNHWPACGKLFVRL